MCKRTHKHQTDAQHMLLPSRANTYLGTGRRGWAIVVKQKKEPDVLKFTINTHTYSHSQTHIHSHASKHTNTHGRKTRTQKPRKPNTHKQTHIHIETHIHISSQNTITQTINCKTVHQTHKPALPTRKQEGASCSTFSTHTRSS